MNPPPADWYPDPSRRHELRFWDSTQWTEHVASAGTTGVDPLPQPALLPSRRPPRRSRHLGWLGLVVIALAVTFIAIPGVAFARAATSTGIELESGRTEATLPPHEKWGIYIDDADNSGYYLSCTAVDPEGEQIRMRSPGFDISWTDAGTLDLVFDTGGGRLTFSCASSDDLVTARPIPNLGALLGGILAGGLLGVTGVVMIVSWLAGRSSRQQTR